MVLILDGGSTSVLEHINVADHAALMSSPLWTSQALFSFPEQVKLMYREYIAAGAQLVSCMTYQQSDLTMKHVQDLPDAYDVGMRVALEACAGTSAKPVLTLGTHAAMLSSGAEYDHVYAEADRAMLKDFHARRLLAFSSQPSWADIEFLAFETLPDCLEAEVILDVLSQMPPSAAVEEKKIWISFSCSGQFAVEKVVASVSRVLRHSQAGLLWGLGVNCFKEDTFQVVEQVSQLLEGHLIYLVVYPDAGRQWDAVAREFVGQSMEEGQWARRMPNIAQLNAGRVVLGGCCQTGPKHIAAIREFLQI